MWRIQNGTRGQGLGSYDLASTFCFNLGSQVLSMAIPRAEQTVPDIYGSCLAQADMDAWSLAMSLPFTQCLPSCNLGSLLKEVSSPTPGGGQASSLSSPLRSTAYHVLLTPSSKSIHCFSIPTAATLSRTPNFSHDSQHPPCPSRLPPVWSSFSNRRTFLSH